MWIAGGVRPLEFRILGPLEVVGPGGPTVVRGAKRRGLLAYLLVHANDAVSLDRLVDDLWDQRPSSGARGTVQSYVSAFRKLLANDDHVTLETRPTGYVLNLQTECLDAARFERDCARAGGEGDAAKRMELLDAALGLWRGAPLGEFAGAGWADAAATRLEALHRQAVQQRIDARLTLGRHVEAIPELEELVREHRLDERFWAQLMVAYYRAGRQTDALRTYQRARSILADELGIEPCDELAGLERQVLDHDPGLTRTQEAAGGQLSSGTVTFLFTDIEGSTPLWEQHPSAMREALARHDAILRDAVESHGGRIVKSTGDGALAVLRAASDAVGVATVVLRTFSSQTWGATGPLPVRIGIHTGSAEERDGDYFGPSLNRASRLMGAAHGGQVVLSSASAALVRDTLPEGLELVDLGAHRLRGLRRPERMYQLTIAGLRSQFPPLQSLDAFPGSVPVPSPLVARGGKSSRGATPSSISSRGSGGGRAMELGTSRSWPVSPGSARRVWSVSCPTWCQRRMRLFSTGVATRNRLFHTSHSSKHYDPT